MVHFINTLFNGISLSSIILLTSLGNVIKLRKNKIVTGIRNEPVTIFMNIM